MTTEDKTKKTVDILVTWINLIRDMQKDAKLDALDADRLIDAAFETCVDMMDWIDERVKEHVQRS